MTQPSSVAQASTQLRRFQPILWRVLGGLAGAICLILPVHVVQASQCPGFRVIRDRSDREAPRLPRQSIAALAILAADGCDRSGHTSERLPRSQASSRPLPRPAGQAPDSREPTSQPVLLAPTPLERPTR